MTREDNLQGRQPPGKRPPGKMTCIEDDFQQLEISLCSYEAFIDDLNERLIIDNLQGRQPK